MKNCRVRSIWKIKINFRMEESAVGAARHEGFAGSLKIGKRIRSRKDSSVFSSHLPLKGKH